MDNDALAPPTMIIDTTIPQKPLPSGCGLYVTTRHTWLDTREEYYASLASYWQERLDGLCTNGSTAWYEGREETT